MISDDIYLSEILDRPLLDRKGNVIGKIKDLNVIPGETFPVVEGIYIRGTEGLFRILMKNINVLNKKFVTTNEEASAVAHMEPQEKEIRIAEHIMDKQVVDINGAKVVRVNDVQLGQVRDQLGLLAIDVGFGGLIRRLGFGRAKKGALIPWHYLKPLEPGLDRLTLTITRRSLVDMHPVDMAEIVSQLSMQERSDLLSTFDKETTGEIIHELDEETRANIIKQMKPEEAADVLEAMNPDEAADILGDLPDKKADEIIGLMEKEEAEDVIELLEHDEDTAGGLMTTEYVSFPPDMTAGEVMKELRLIAPDIEMIYYLYVVDNREHLEGVLSLKDLIMANPTARLDTVMTKNAKKIHVDADRKEAAEMVSKYNLMAIPVVDDQDTLQGIITVDDIVDFLLPTPLRKRR